jgi:hypothetical protein
MNRSKEKRNKILFLSFGLLLALLALLAAAPSNVTHGRNIRVNNVKSLNWAGYVVASNFSNPQPVVTMVNASWIVQNVSCSKKSSTYSSQWVGIGGYFKNDSSLIQVGTESDCINGKAKYGAWYELLPNAETPIKNMTVSAGDKILATIYLVPNTTNQWSITIKNENTGQFYTTIVTYNSSELSGEWIEERPALCTGIVCRLTTLANFGIAYYGFNYTGMKQTEFATVDGTTKQIGELPYENITMVSNSGSVLASPSSLSFDGTSFFVTYGSGSTSTHQVGAKAVGIETGASGVVH